MKVPRIDCAKSCFKVLMSTWQWSSSKVEDLLEDKPLVVTIVV